MKKLLIYFLFVKLYYIMLNILNKYRYLIILVLLTITAICATFYHNIHLIVDCGREVYYPQEILGGKVLYKDLFNIYGPFAYLFNAFLFKIFGINLSVLSVAGSICAICIILGLFFVAQLFLKEEFAFSIGLIGIAVGIVPAHLFNYVFPYAFAMSYGLCAFIFSLLFLICYINSKKNLFLYISLFFAGLSVSCKYEFLLYVLVYLPVFFRLKTNFNTIFIGLLCFGIVPEMSFAFLFAKGLSISDLLNTAKIIVNMLQTDTLKYFYIHSGIFFHTEVLKLILKSFLFMFLTFFVYMIPIIFKDKIKNPVVGLIFTYSAFCLLFLFRFNERFDIFMSLPIVLFLSFLINSKNIIKNLSVFVLIVSVLLVSLKIFFGALLASYGVYYIPLLLTACAVCFKEKMTEKEWGYVGFYITVFSLLIMFFQYKFVSLRNCIIQTPKGKIYTEQEYETTNKLIDYINKNTKKTDKILILPEGMMINFLSDRKTDDFYNSMLPLYEETFGIDSYVEHFKKDMPDYIIFNSWDSKDYYFSIICKDYGFKFCEFTMKNYDKKIKLSGDFSYVVFKKK